MIEMKDDKSGGLSSSSSSLDLSSQTFKDLLTFSDKIGSLKIWVSFPFVYTDKSTK